MEQDWKFTCQRRRFQAREERRLTGKKDWEWSFLCCPCHVSWNEMWSRDKKSCDLSVWSSRAKTFYNERKCFQCRTKGFCFRCQLRECSIGLCCRGSGVFVAETWCERRWLRPEQLWRRSAVHDLGTRLWNRKIHSSNGLSVDRQECSSDCKWTFAKHVRTV